MADRRTYIASPRTAALLLCALLCACAAPSWRRDVLPDWREAVETGTQFHHRTIFKPGSGRELHIYLDGDGRLWRTPDELNADPTPLQSLALQLMAKDPAPALFIGRPCYFATGDAACAPRWWIGARYSKPVVASLAAVAARWSADYDSAMLIGYSGGGALAVLMAPQLPRVQGVVTLAGNLDTAAWLAHHHYAAAVLDESLDPSQQAPLPARIAQRHYAGDRDDNILWPWIAAFSARESHSIFIRLEGFDHRCCWLQQWPALLEPPQNAPVQNSMR